MFKIRTFAIPSLAMLASAAQAAVPLEVMTELGTMKTDALVVAAVVLVAIIALAAFKFIRKGL